MAKKVKTDLKALKTVLPVDDWLGKKVKVFGYSTSEAFAPRYSTFRNPANDKAIGHLHWATLDDLDPSEYKYSAMWTTKGKKSMTQLGVMPDNASRKPQKTPFAFLGGRLTEGGQVFDLSDVPEVPSKARPLKLVKYKHNVAGDMDKLLQGHHDYFADAETGKVLTPYKVSRNSNFPLYEPAKEYGIVTPKRLHLRPNGGYYYEFKKKLNYICFIK